MERPAQAVTFDFHNTLAHCDKWFQLEIRNLVPAFLDWLADSTHSGRLPVSDADASASYRRLRLEIMEHGMEVDAVSCVDFVTREFGYPLERDTICAGVCAIMRETLSDASPVPGAVDAVRHLHAQGIRLGVVSSAAYHPFLEWSLEKFGILDAFDSIITSASCGYYKTRTEIYSVALDALQVPAENLIHVGDSHRFDVETSSRLGIRTIWFNRDGDSEQVSSATESVTSLCGVEHVATRLLRGSA